jgi:hypothetical protein
MEEKIMNDTGRSTSQAPVADRYSLCWLAIACGLLAFSNGARIVPLAAWLGPLFLVRFLRTQKAGRGLVAGYLVTAGVFYSRGTPRSRTPGRPLPFTPRPLA